MKTWLIIAVMHKTIQAWTGLEPMTSAILVQCSTDWIKPSGSWSIMNIWKIIYLNCGERYEFISDHRSYTHKQLWKLKPKQLLKLCVTAMINHIFISFSGIQICDISYNVHSFASFNFYGYLMNSQSDQLPDGLIAQLVGNCTGIAEVVGSNPVQAWIFFSGFNFSQLLTLCV